MHSSLVVRLSDEEHQQEWSLELHKLVTLTPLLWRQGWMLCHSADQVKYIWYYRKVSTHCSVMCKNCTGLFDIEMYGVGNWLWFCKFFFNDPCQLGTLGCIIYEKEDFFTPVFHCQARLTSYHHIFFPTLYDMVVDRVSRLNLGKFRSKYSK